MSVDQKTRLEFEQLKPLIGSIVRCDREALFDPAIVKQIREELDARAVLVFPQVGLSNAEQIAFTDLLGKRQNLGFGTADEVHQVTLDKKITRAPEYVLGTFFYHIDGMTTSGAPPYATLLTARRVAAEGGQTEFASTAAAYDRLTSAEKAEYEQLHIVHSVESSLRMIADVIPETHVPKLGMDMKCERPLVYTRRSGRKSLLIGTTADTVVGMDVPKGRSIIARLNEWAGQPEFSYRHQWQEGDFVVWVNTAALHRAIPYDAESGRMMHRTSVAAEN